MDLEGILSISVIAEDKMQKKKNNLTKLAY